MKCYTFSFILEGTLKVEAEDEDEAREALDDFDLHDYIEDSEITLESVEELEDETTLEMISPDQLPLIDMN